jgi:hypothetical protein
VAELPIPVGVLQRDGDWVFDDWAGGGEITGLGLDPGNPPSVERAARAASAAEDGASAPAAGASAPASVPG